ncbi:MAG: hypothetical protein M1457_04320, partial [bacterium]|nr:hypothetical protein [bacterium]
MLKPRNVIIIAVILAVAALGASLVDLVRPPDSGGLGADSYGTWGWGQRALYETVGDLGIPVERSFIPPDRQASRGVCLAFLGPNPWLVAREPVYLKRIAD